jgi:nuclear transport factor 2 (NTF2) superfamily protein
MKKRRLVRPDEERSSQRLPPFLPRRPVEALAMAEKIWKARLAIPGAYDELHYFPNGQWFRQSGRENFALGLREPMANELYTPEQSMAWFVQYRIEVPDELLRLNDDQLSNASQDRCS